jgi:hypothetical protein
MDLRALLREEFDRRRSRNPRYSLRAFARQLGTHHSTLSRLLVGGRRLTSERVRSLGARLGLGTRQIAGACLHENMKRVAALASRPTFRANTRWIATRTGLSIDDVNVALQFLLFTQRMTMTSMTEWTPGGAR